MKSTLRCFRGAKDDHWLAHFASHGVLDPHTLLQDCAGATAERLLGGGIPALLGVGLVFATANGCAIGMLLANLP